MAQDKPEFDLIINKVEHKWKDQFVDGKQIKSIAGSPADFVVNQIVAGPGEDPEIGDAQKVDLSHEATPKGIKKFVTRKPTTSPGA